MTSFAVLHQLLQNCNRPDERLCPLIEISDVHVTRTVYHRLRSRKLHQLLSNVVHIKHITATVPWQQKRYVSFSQLKEMLCTIIRAQLLNLKYSNVKFRKNWSWSEVSVLCSSVHLKCDTEHSPLDEPWTIVFINRSFRTHPRSKSPRIIFFKENVIFIL